MTLPPGPTAHPLRQLAHWLRDPLGYLEQSATEFGDVFTARWGNQSIVLVSEPGALQTLLTSSGVTAPGDVNRFARPLVGDTSLLLLDGKPHQQRRKLLMPPLHGDHLLSYGELICDITQQVIARWTSEHPFNVNASMQELTLQIILRVVFGLDEGERLQELKERLVARLEMTAGIWGPFLIFLPILQQDLGPWSPWGQLMKRHRACDEVIYTQIRERKEHFNPHRTDILNLLISAQDEEGNSLRDVELRDELVTLLFAGHESTSATLTWALHWIYANSNIRERLLEELGSTDPQSDPVAVTQLPYLDAVCNEILRIYPVNMTTLPRRVCQPIEILGYTLEPGTTVAGAIYLTHHREELYPESKTFNPQRFLDRRFSTFEFIPFGNGSRRCIGDGLAIFEMKLVITTILKRVNLGLTASRAPQPVRRRTILAPESSFSMKALANHSPHPVKI